MCDCRNSGCFAFGVVVNCWEIEMSIEYYLWGTHKHIIFYVYYYIMFGKYLWEKIDDDCHGLWKYFIPILVYISQLLVQKYYIKFSYNFYFVVVYVICCLCSIVSIVKVILEENRFFTVLSTKTRQSTLLLQGSDTL